MSLVPLNVSANHSVIAALERSSSGSRCSHTSGRHHHLHHSSAFLCHAPLLLLTSHSSTGSSSSSNSHSNHGNGSKWGSRRPKPEEQRNPREDLATTRQHRRGRESRGRWGAGAAKGFVTLVRSRIGGVGDYQLVPFESDDFAVERLVGTLGFMNISSYTPRSFSSIDSNEAAGVGASDLFRSSGQQIGQGDFQIRIYRGRIVVPGPRLGTRVVFKVYPGVGPAAADADVMAANELAVHAALQEDAPDSEVSNRSNSYEDRSDLAHVSILFGGFQTGSGEKWLVLRDDGVLTASDYARLACEALAENTSVGGGDFWDRFEPSRPIARRHVYIRQLIRGMLKGLGSLHSKGRVHGSLGPASVVLNVVEERDAPFLIPRLRDFAFSININDPAVLSASDVSGEGPLGEAVAGLWRRAKMEGVTNSMERRTFAVADDIYAAGLLVAFLCFVPLCQKGSIDGPSLQRLLESTFRLDLQAAREYCEADDRWERAVEFLSQQDGAGWDLLQAMLNPDFRKRPTAEGALNHPFLKG